MECFGDAQTIFTERNRRNVRVWKKAAVTITYFEILVFLNSDNVLRMLITSTMFQKALAVIYTKWVLKHGIAELLKFEKYFLEYF